MTHPTLGDGQFSMEGPIVSADLAKPAMMRGSAIIPAPDAVPVIEWSSENPADTGLYGFDSRDVRSRPFNLLRRRILRQVEARGWKLFGVAGATPGVGKSFVAANLAAALSRTPDLVVYLFDFDLRKSSVASMFGIPEEGQGISHYLKGEISTLAPAARRLAGQDLVVVPAVRQNIRSAELLSGGAMDVLVDAMKSLPDNAICICDLPPVFANDDAAIIAPKLDCYLLVLEEGRTTRKQVKDSMNLLAPAACGGTILNRYYGGLIHDDYGYGYGHAAGYGEYFR